MLQPVFCVNYNKQRDKWLRFTIVNFILSSCYTLKYNLFIRLNSVQSEKILKRKCEVPKSTINNKQIFVTFYMK